MFPEAPQETDYYIDFLITAFFELTTCRDTFHEQIPTQDGKQIRYKRTQSPIHWTAINQYCIAHKIAPDNRQEFLWLIRHMDNHFLTRHNKMD